jgi:hypothetical protein
LLTDASRPPLSRRKKMQLREVREPLYDTYTAAQGATLPATINLFSTGLKDGKTLNQTNLDKGGELVSPERATVFGVRVIFFATAEDDIAGILANYALKIQVSGQDQLRSPIELLPACAGISGSTTKTQNGALNAVAFQLPEGFEIDIEGGNIFNVQLVGAAAYVLTDGTLGVGIKVVLDSLHTLQS